MARSRRTGRFIRGSSRRSYTRSRGRSYGRRGTRRERNRLGQFTR